MQSLCFLAGANSMFYGDKLLTTSNPQAEKDRQLIQRLGMHCATEAELSADADADATGDRAPGCAPAGEGAAAGCGHRH